MACSWNLKAISAEREFPSPSEEHRNTQRLFRDEGRGELAKNPFLSVVQRLKGKYPIIPTRAHFR